MSAALAGPSDGGLVESDHQLQTTCVLDRVSCWCFSVLIHLNRGQKDTQDSTKKENKALPFNKRKSNGMKKG